MPEEAKAPEIWKATSGLDWEDELQQLKSFTRGGALPTVFNSFLNSLDGEDLSKKGVLRTTWMQAEKVGLIKDIPPWLDSQYTVMLEEGDTLVFAYRVMEKDVGFKLKQWITVPSDPNDDWSLPTMTDKYYLRETLYSRLGTFSIGFWKPATGFEEPSEEELQEYPDAKPSMQIELIWDNTYSWFESKKIMAVVGVLKHEDPASQGALNVGKKNASMSLGSSSGKWTRTIERPLAVSETLTRSSSLTLSSSLKDLGFSEEEGHKLDKKQCDTAADRIRGKAGFLEEIALVGYLKEIGQSPDKDTIAAVKKDIKAGCDITGSDLAVSSDAEFLTKEQCDKVKELVGSKKGPLAELTLKHFIKELGKKPSPKMMSRATEQITTGCEDEADLLTTPQCRGIAKSVEKVKGGPEKKLKEIQRGLESFGQSPTAKLVVETANQISNRCPSNGLSLDGGVTTEEVPRRKAPEGGPKKKKVEEAQLSTDLDPGECRKAQQAIKGAPTMFVEIHLKRWLKENGKDDSPKTCAAVLAQLKGDCGEETPPVDVQVKKEEGKEEKDSSISSGTTRRKDFVDDPRFAKYRMMKKLRQPEGAVNGRISMDKGDLLKAGLTELELECFVQLLFEKVEECNVAPPKGGKVLTLEMITNDERLKKYRMMHKLKQPRGSCENRMTMDKADLLKAGLTEAELDCVLKLLYDGVAECDASPAGKVLDQAFVDTDNPLFKKYRMMYKLKQPSGAVEGRILMDWPDLEKLGFTKTEMECFVKLLFKEVDKCICGPAERAEKQSKEAKGLAIAKDVHEKLTSILDGDNGLMPGVMPSLDWATEIFEVKIPAKDKPKKDNNKQAKAPEQETYLDGKTQQNLGIILKQFPKDMIFEGYLTEIGRAEWSFLRQANEKPLLTDLETMQRAVNTVSDNTIEEFKGKIDKITEKHDQPHRFVKALAVIKKDNDKNLNDIMTCMIQKDKYENAIKDKADTLEKLQNYYKDAGKLGGTLSAAVNGFVVQLLNARIDAAKDSSKVTNEAFGQYDLILRKFRQTSGSGDEADSAIVPLLALNNVIIDYKSNRLRSALVRSHPELAKTMSPSYLKLFKKYLDSVKEAEKKQALKATEEPPLTFAECEEAKEARDKAKNDMFKEMAVNNYLKSIKKTNLKAKVLEQLKDPCKKPPVAGPLTDDECHEAESILKATPNPMFQGIKLANYFKEIGKVAEKKECQAQVDAGCPSANPPEPLYTMSSLGDMCKAVVSIDEEPSIRNSVRGVLDGVTETQKKVQACLAVMPAMKQEPYEALMEEGEVVIDQAKEIQDSVFEAVIQTASPFLPHSKDGIIDKKKLWSLHDGLPSAGGQEDDERIRGTNGVPSTYSISDFLDDETLRYSMKRICKALLEDTKF